MNLYHNLKRKSEEDVRCRLQLHALQSTLRRFNIPEEEWEVMAEAILGVEKIGEWTPADDRMRKLKEMLDFFQMEAGK